MATAWDKANPEKMREYRARWKANNPEKFRQSVARTTQRRKEKVAAYHKAHPEYARATASRRRARRRGALTLPFTFEQLAAKMTYWGNRCWMCKKDWQEVDHVKPLSKGGAHCLANFRPICSDCNKRKGATWPLPQLEQAAA